MYPPAAVTFCCDVSLYTGLFRSPPHTLTAPDCMPESVCLQTQRAIQKRSKVHPGTNK